jgi:5'-nucleotidase
MSTPRTRRLARALAVTTAAPLAVTMSTGSALAGGHGHDHGHGHGHGQGHGHGKPDHRPPFTQNQLLSFNDFHGNLEAPSGSGGRLTTGYTETQDPKTLQYSAKAQTVDAGGVEYLATHLKQARQGHANTVTVAAGDLIGASPLLSAAFHDEPTIEAMNALGLDASAVG